jgi:hypothetical protein
MVTPEVWKTAGMPPPTIRGYNETDGDFLCIGCLERRIGRRLKAMDFTVGPINDPDNPWNTPRLRERLSGAIDVWNEVS